VLGSDAGCPQPLSGLCFEPFSELLNLTTIRFSTDVEEFPERPPEEGIGCVPRHGDDSRAALSGGTY